MLLRKPDRIPFYVSMAIAALVCLGLKYRLDSKRVPWPQPKITVKGAEYFASSARRSSLGFDNVVANLLWIELLQEASHEPLKADESSWEFAQLNAILTLDPKLDRAYPFGASFLTVFRRDKEGARRILQRWVSRRPTYWRSHYMLAFHLYTEMNDYQAASQAMLRAATMENAPDWLTALGVRLITEHGAPLLALQVALELYPTIPTQEGRIRLASRIASLRLHLAKTAWQRAVDDYRKEQGKAPISLDQVKDRIAAENRSLASATQDLEVHEELLPIFLHRFEFKYNPKNGIVEYNGPTFRGLDVPGIHRPN